MLSILKRDEKMIPHFYMGKNYARDLRESLMKQPPKRKDAYFVFGEFSSVSSVKKVLEYGYNANVLMGPEFSASSKDDIVKLKQKYGDRFKIYRSNNRPESHGMLFDDNLFFEDKHKNKQQYERAILIKNASRKEISHFIDLFHEDTSILKESSLEDIERTPTIST